MKEVGQVRHIFIFLITWVSVLQKGAENSSKPGEEEAIIYLTQKFGDQARHNSETRTVKGIGNSVHTCEIRPRPKGSAEAVHLCALNSCSVHQEI